MQSRFITCNIRSTIFLKVKVCQKGVQSRIELPIVERKNKIENKERIGKEEKLNKRQKTKTYEFILTCIYYCKAFV